MDPFTESLVANVSPYASPFHMTSPIKRGRQSCHPRRPDLMDEGSVDIYGDILDVEIPFDPVTSVPLDDDNDKQSTSKSTFIASNGGDEDQSTSKRDLSTDVLTTDSSTNEEIEELKDENKKLRAENEALATSKVQLTKNISCLFMTSRRELQKKDAELEELRNTVKELQTKLKELELIPLKVTKEIRPALSKSHENRQRGAFPNSSEVKRSKQSLKDRGRDQRRPSSAERSIRSSRHWLERGRSSKESDRKERRQSPIELDRTKFKREDRKEGRSKRSQRSRDSSSGHKVNVDQISRSERRKDMVKKSSPNPEKSRVDEKISQTNKKSPPNSSKRSQDHIMYSKTSPSSSKESRKLSTHAASSNKASSCTEKTLPKEHLQITSSHAEESSMSSKHSQQNISSKTTESTSSKMSHDPSPPSAKLIKQSEERPPSPPPNPASPTDGMETSLATGESHQGEEEAEHQKKSLDSEKQKQETSVKETERKLSSETSKTKDAISPGLDHNHSRESDSKLNKTVSSKSHFECLKGNDQETEEGNISKNPLADNINFSHEKQSIQPSVPNVNSHSKEIKSELKKRSDKNLKIWTSVKDLCGGTRLLELVKDKTESHSNEQVVVSKLNEKDNTVFQVSSNAPSTFSQRGVESRCSSHSDSSNNAHQLSLQNKSLCLSFTKSAEKSLSCFTNKEAQKKPISFFDNKTGDISLTNSVVSNKEAQKPISLFDNKTGDISLTNSVVSNQDWCSMSPNSSVPFSRMNCSEIDPPSKDKESQSKNNTDSQMLTNQTWPFEQRESTTLCEDASVPMGEKTNEEEKGVREDGEKIEQKASDDPIRAFPISKFENDGNSVSNDLVSSARFSNNGGIDSLDSRPDSNENETETTSLPSSITSESMSGNSGEACSKDSSNSGEACSKDSNESESTSNGSEKSSLEAKVAADNLDFHSPQKRGNLWTHHHLYDHEDGTNLTPPKPRFKPPIPQELTPAKYNNVKESTIDSPNLMCTPNLIVLGDEEATCATLFSPFKSVPSEFIPPGVRKEIKEVNTHHRHIRGKPELLHESPTPLSPSSEEVCGGLSQGEDEDEDMIPETETSLNNDDMMKSSNASVSAERPKEVEVTLQPVLLKAFQEVFNQDLSDFKNEMIITSKKNNEILKSRLRKSAECIKQSIIPCGDANSSSAQGEASVSNVSINEQTEESTCEKGSKAGCPEECVTKRPPTPTSSHSPAASLATEKHTAIVKDSVWHKSFNVHNPQSSKVRKSVSHPNVHFSQSTEEYKDSEQFSCNEKNLIDCNQDTTEDFLCAEKENLSFSSTTKSLSKTKSDQGRKLCYSPVSCGVTSSGLQHVDHDVVAEKTLPSLQPTTSKTPPTTSTSDAWSSLEPDSTSDPVVSLGLQHCKQPKATGEKTSRCSKSTRDTARTTRGRGLTESHSPDSPSKDLGYFKGLAATRQSPRRARKIALNIHSSDDASPKTSPCHDDNSDHNNVQSDGSLKVVHSDLQLSSSSDDSDSETDEETLNATQLIAQDVSIHPSADCDKTEIVASSASLCPGENKTVGRSLPAWDLMEANSLSEFDRDVILEQQRLARSVRGSSRTASISSHISVGVYSPMSVSSNKMSTPSHIASPKDSLWSPMNRTSESLDSCQEDVRTPPVKKSYDGYAKEWTFSSAGSEGSSFSPATEEIASIQLTRLLSLQEMQRLKLVKTNFVVSHSSSESDSSSDDDSDNSSSSSSSDSDADKSYQYRTPVKCQKTLQQSSKNSPLLNQGTSFPATPSPRAKRKTPLKSPTSLTPTALFKDKLLDSPRRSPRNKMKGESTLYEVSPRKRLNLQVHALLSPSQDAKRKRGAQCGRELGAQCDKKLSDTGRREDIILNQRKASHESSIIGHEEYVKDELMVATTGPRKSVRIMEESWACETIVVGSCSREDHALLKRLSLGDSSREASSGKSPVTKPAIMTSNSCNNTDNTKDKSRATVKEGGENSKKTGGNQATAGVVRGCASESQVGSGPNMERRPLSLQEGIKTDPLLASSRAEFVHNVKKVTRKLDLDKENSASRKIAISPQENCDERKKSGQTDAVDKNIGKNAEGRADDQKSVAEPKPDSSDDLEEGEITSDDEPNQECEQKIPKINNKGGKSSVQQKDGKKQNNQQQSGSSRLHITQEGCKVVSCSKTAMSAKRGKNFVSRKNSDHGISPMERVDTPPLSSSLNDRTKVKRPLRGRANKRLRSLSPIEPEQRRPVKIQRRDSTSNGGSKKQVTENSRLPQQSVSASSSSSNTRRSLRNVSPMSSCHHRHHRSSSSCSCKSLSGRRSNSPRRRDREARDSHTHRCQRSNERTATRRSREDSRGRHCDRGKERPERPSSRTCSSSCHGCEVLNGGRKGADNSSKCRSSSISGRHLQEEERHRRDRTEPAKSGNSGTCRDTSSSLSKSHHPTSSNNRRSSSPGHRDTSHSRSVVEASKRSTRQGSFGGGGSGTRGRCSTKSKEDDNNDNRDRSHSSSARSRKPE